MNSVQGRPFLPRFAGLCISMQEPGNQLGHASEIALKTDSNLERDEVVLNGVRLGTSSRVGELTDTLADHELTNRKALQAVLRQIVEHEIDTSTADVQPHLFSNNLGAPQQTVVALFQAVKPAILDLIHNPYEFEGNLSCQRFTSQRVW